MLTALLVACFYQLVLEGKWPLNMDVPLSNVRRLLLAQVTNLVQYPVLTVASQIQRAQKRSQRSQSG